MYIATKILLTSLTTISTPDLCDVVHAGTDAPMYCTPHGDGAPVYNRDVCCSNGTCVPTTGGQCVTGQKRYYCELGEVNALNVVSCYFEVPDYCEVYTCELDIRLAPQEDTICCVFGVCTPYSVANCDAANMYHCNSVKDNGDGTVDCLDWEEE